MTTPATAMPATTPAKEQEPMQTNVQPAPPKKPVRAVQEQEQRPPAVNEQTPFFE